MSKFSDEVKLAARRRRIPEAHEVVKIEVAPPGGYKFDGLTTGSDGRIIVTEIGEEEVQIPAGYRVLLKGEWDVKRDARFKRPADYDPTESYIFDVITEPERFYDIRVDFGPLTELSGTQWSKFAEAQGEIMKRRRA